MIRFFWNTCKSFISLIYILCILVFLNVLDTKIPLEASVINVDLNPKTPGFKDFFKGRAHFEEGNWNEAIDYFNCAIKKSKKPRYDCSDFLVFYEREFSACEEGGETCHYNQKADTWECWEETDESNVYFISDISNETSYAVYRYSHFYFGLIQLYRGEIKSANFHFKRAIGFLDDKKMGSLFYRLVNIIDP